MPKPAARTPRAGSSAQNTPAEPAGGSFGPAPDNGVPFGEGASRLTDRPAIKRRGVQVNARVPEDIHDRFMAYVKGSRLPKGALIARALLDAAERNGY